MNKIVLDASAILAIVNAEPGYEKLIPELLVNSIVSTVNLAEAHSKLVSRGWPQDEAWRDSRALVGEVVPFDERQARVSGDLVIETQRLGLSLGDRACLALGVVLGAPVYTVERLWKGISVGVTIHLIR